jgi:PHD/YefM family antitoxin component YafN of YafNO toxin-antitoxin module
MKSFMTSFTVEQIQTNFEHTIDFIQTGKPLTITQDGQPAVILFSFKEGSKLLRLRHAARLEDYYAKRIKNVPQGVLELSIDDIHKLVAGLRP